MVLKGNSHLIRNFISEIMPPAIYKAFYDVKVYTLNKIVEKLFDKLKEFNVRMNSTIIIILKENGQIMDPKLNIYAAELYAIYCALCLCKNGYFINLLNYCLLISIKITLY